MHNAAYPAVNPAALVRKLMGILFSGGASLAPLDSRLRGNDECVRSVQGAQ